MPPLQDLRMGILDIRMSKLNKVVLNSHIITNTNRI